VPQRLWLEHYATHYLTVENNNSFYRLPSRETFAAWRERTPDDFVMAVKASRYLTHVRRLRDPAEPVARLLGAAAGLGPKLGPVLLQLPPTLKADPDTLGACLTEFRTAATALGHHALRLAVEQAVFVLDADEAGRAGLHGALLHRTEMHDEIAGLLLGIGDAKPDAVAGHQPRRCVG